jgi:AcrR family transcriptional regulator
MGTKQQEKSLQTRMEIMAAARRLFGEKGFAATTVSEITADAGYAKGNFYRHWQSKDELLLEIIEQKLHGYRKKREKNIKKAHSLEEVMNGIWDFLETMIDDKNWSRVFLEFTIHASRNDELKKKLNDGMYRLSNDIFADMVAPFVETGYSPEKIGAMNTALFEGFLIHSILETDTISKEDARDAAVLLALARGKQ